MYEWENAFNQTILERGKKYANGNRVKIVSTDYKTTSAVVRGSQQYNVSVRLTKAGGFAGGSCDCPYAIDHHRCKHMAAVLYKWSRRRASLERAMTRLEALNAEPENNSFFRELDYLLLDSPDHDRRRRGKVWHPCGAPDGDIKTVYHRKYDC